MSLKALIEALKQKEAVQDATGDRNSPYEITIPGGVHTLLVTECGAEHDHDHTVAVTMTLLEVHDDATRADPAQVMLNVAAHLGDMFKELRARNKVPPFFLAFLIQALFKRSGLGPNDANLSIEGLSDE